jgi:hypothetical protein
MQLRSASNNHHAALVVDDALPTERGGRLTDGGAWTANHFGDEIVSELEPIAFRSARRQEQPPGQPLNGRVESVANRRLRQLENHRLRVRHQ